MDGARARGAGGETKPEKKGRKKGEKMRERWESCGKMYKMWKMWKIVKDGDFCGLKPWDCFPSLLWYHAQVPVL